MSDHDMRGVMGEHRLAALLEPDTPAPPGRRSLVAGRQRLRLRRARRIAIRRAGRDPVTGFRGEGAGAQVAARLGNAMLACELLIESAGPCLRGQITGATQDEILGALVHVRTSAGTTLACVGPGGEFAARSLAAERIERIDIEFASETWSLARPFEDAS